MSSEIENPHGNLSGTDDLTTEQWIELLQLIEDVGGASVLKAQFESPLDDSDEDIESEPTLQDDDGVSSQALDESWPKSSPGTGTYNKSTRQLKIRVPAKGTNPAFDGEGTITGPGHPPATFKGTLHFRNHTDVKTHVSICKRLPTGKNFGFHQGPGTKHASFRVTTSGGKKGPLAGRFRFK